MAKEMPVGTIRDWASGRVIKAHLPIPPFSSGWITLKENSDLNRLGAACDSLASVAKSYTMPINGEKFLDHEIDNYEDEDGYKIFTADDFKQYLGWHGAGYYAFKNEFYKQFMSDEMKLSEEIYDAYAEENEKRGGHKANDLLSKEEKRVIRDRTIREHKTNESRFTIAKAEKLKEIIEKTIGQIKEGVNFKDLDKKELYDHFIADMDSMPVLYDRIKVKKDLRNSWIEKINATFTDNWGVRESCKDYANKKFNEYVRKFSKEISRDSLEDQLAAFGVTIDMEPDEFYNKIYDKIRSTDLSETSGEYGDFKDLIYLRFMNKYGKSVEGDWRLEHLPAIHNLENAIVTLPQGHFLTNDHLTLITNQDYKGGSHGGYAWYDGSDKRINFSASCVDRGSVFGVLSDPHEFKSTLLHEIGHAVSNKLGRAGFYDYKKFVVECGWTYESPELRAGATATGDDKDIPRTGSNSSLSLISDYSKKSPEEAFAEYYSFYATNKDRIDKFLATGDKHFLDAESRVVSATETSERSIRETMSHRILRPDSHEIGVFNDVINKLSHGEDHNRIELISPWDTKMTAGEKARYSTDKIKQRKNDSIASMPPVVTYIDNGKNHVIDGSTRVEVARMNKRLVPSITISKELYFKLKESGLNERQISDCVYTKNRLESLIKEAIPKEVIHGLIHRNRLIKSSKVVTNANILKVMKSIYESTELQKAMQSLFSHDEDVFEKAFSEGSISGEVLDIIKGKDISKLKKIKKLIYRDGKLIYATYYVKTGETVSDDAKVGYSGVIEQDVTEGDHLEIKTKRRHMRGEVCGFSFEAATALHWIAILGEDSGKTEWVRLDAITAMRKSDVTGVTTEPAKPTTKGVKISDFKLLSSLGGSSDVKLMEAGGNKWAVKKARDRSEGKGQLRDEYIADRIYQTLGFSAPDSFLIEEGEYKVAPYLEGYRELGAAGVATHKKEIQKGFVLDCLLANWDVIGAGYDNILCKAGKVVRIDNGGSLRYRARGGDKASLFTPDVKEIMTFLDADKNEQAAKVFDGITMEDIKRQATDIVAYKEAILKCTEGDAWLKKRLGERIEWLRVNYVDKPVAPPKPKVPTPRADMPSMLTQNYFDNGWDKLDVDYGTSSKSYVKKHILDVEKRNEHYYSKYAAAHGITVEEYKQKAQEFVEKAVSRSSFFITVHSSTSSGKSVLQKIFTKAGRFKSLFETGTGSGSTSTLARANCEEALFGFPNDPARDKDKRAIYGYWTPDGNGIINGEGTIPPPNFVRNYGDVNVEIKREVAMKKATITFHDSLGGEDRSAATPASKPHFTSLGAADAIELQKQLGSKSTSFNQYSYVEAQYHNQLGLSDVTKVHMSPEAFPGDRKDKMKRLTSAVNSMTEFAAETGNKEIKIEIF